MCGLGGGQARSGCWWAVGWLSTSVGRVWVGGGLTSGSGWASRGQAGGRAADWCARRESGAPTSAPRITHQPIYMQRSTARTFALGLADPDVAPPRLLQARGVVIPIVASWGGCRARCTRAATSASATRRQNCRRVTASDDAAAPRARVDGQHDAQRTERRDHGAASLGRGQGVLGVARTYMLGRSSKEGRTWEDAADITSFDTLASQVAHVERTRVHALIAAEAGLTLSHVVTCAVADPGPLHSRGRVSRRLHDVGAMLLLLLD